MKKQPLGGLSLPFEKEIMDMKGSVHEWTDHKSTMLFRRES